MSKNKLVKIEHRFIFLAIALLGFIVYFNSLLGKFIWDDYYLIVDNTHLRNWVNLKHIFLEHIGSGSGIETNFYRPLQIFSYMIDFSLWKLNTIGYHLTNVLSHILVAITLCWLIYILFDDFRVAFLTGMLYVVHPVHTEAVSYIAGRADSLAAIFLLLSLIFYIIRISSKRKIFYILMLLSYVLALLSKESSIMLPLLPALYSLIFKREILIKELLSLFCVTFIYFILRTTILNFPFPEDLLKTSLLQRMPGFFVALFEYSRLLLFPFNLHSQYIYESSGLTRIKAIMGILILVALVLIILKKGRANQLIAFSISWFLLLLPVSNLYQINAYMAEHWLYLPSIGFFTILAHFLIRLYDSKHPKEIAISAIILIVFFYSYLTIRQNNYWKDNITFSKRTLMYVRSKKMYNNLCKDYREAGNFGEAVMACKKSIEIDPKFLDSYYNLASVYICSGDYKDAISEYKKILEIFPDEKAAYYEMGNLYDKMGRKNDAMGAFLKAIAISSDYLEAWNNLAAIYADLGETDKAIELWNKALQINPNFAPAHSNLAVFYFSRKQYPLAIKHCKAMLKLGYEVYPELLKLLQPYLK